MARPVDRTEPSRARRVLTPLLTIVALLALWQAVVVVGIVPNFLLPTPVQVVQALVEDAALLASHCVTTLAEAAAGLAAGVWKSPEEFASLLRTDAVFQPRSDAEERARRMEEWHRAVKRASGWIQDE